MFYSLKVKSLKKETSEAVSISFDVPQELEKNFEFKSGQFLTIEKKLNGEDIRRSYSICSTPKSGDLKVVVKQIEKGVFSTYANNELKEGDELNVAAPSGTFFIQTRSNANNHYVLFAAGSGITPIFGMIKTILSEEPFSKISLFYGNKDEQSVIFKSEFEQLVANNGGRLEVEFIYSRSKDVKGFNKGRIDKDKVKEIFKKRYKAANVESVYACGPQEMVDVIKTTLVKKFNYDAHKVHFELFFVQGGAVSKKPYNGETDVVAIIDGDQVAFKIVKNRTLLESGLNAGHDIPYSCQGGVCGACKCIIIDGETELLNNFALSDDEVESGFSLACQTLAKSADLKVSFDF